MFFIGWLAAIFYLSSLISAEDQGSLFQDLEIVEAIDRHLKEELPFFYNSLMIGGYFNTPSARVPKEGMIALGASRVAPYNNYGASYQYFDRVELAFNYRVFAGVLEKNFGHLGFGSDADRMGSFKLVFNLRSDGLPHFPQIAIGMDDFLGTKRFYSEYIVATECWNRANLEISLGWGRHHLKGFFGGVAWSPWRKTEVPILKNSSFILEYDAHNYEHHPHEHPWGRKVNTRLNAGISYILKDTLQLSVSSHRGHKISAMGSIRYPLGTTQGFIPKSREPLLYKSPIDIEPLGVTRSHAEFTSELGYALGLQGLDLYRIYITPEGGLWIKIINNMYREEAVIRDRIQRLLAAITPSNVREVTVVIESDGVICQGYHFRTEDLYRYREGGITKYEMATLSPMRDTAYRPPGSLPLYKRTKEVWLFTLYPRIQTFFGSSTGKFKYNLSLVATPEGYLFDSIYYQTRFGYAIKSSMQHLGDFDRLNPSQLPNVRTDSVRYYQSNTFSLESAYLQKSWALGKGWFSRIGLGYFEPAYGGVATEVLYYPVQSAWAVGIEEATVWKRRYKGVNFTRKIRRLKHFTAIHEKFLGIQYFLTLHYTFKLWNLDAKISCGQFLAKDKGVRFEINRFFPSGLQVSLWYTITNGHDRVNGRRYFDKGFAFYLPIDFFLRQSSRTYIGYAISAWLRDVGASAETGKQLYPTLRLERVNLK